MKQPPPKKVGRVDTLEIRARLFKLVGNQRAELYFRSFNRFLSCQLGKEEFHKICVGLLGKENIKLHNSLIKGIYHNARAAARPPPSEPVATGNSQTSTVSNGTVSGGVLAARKMQPVITQRRRSGDKPSPLGKSPLGQRGPGEFVSTGSEEVDQARGSPVCVQSQSPIRAPLGVATLQNSQPSTSFDVCYSSGELLDSELLLKHMEDKLKDHGLTVAGESADALNSGLNVYISQMLKACLDIAKARRNKAWIPPPNGGSAAAAVNNGQQHGFPVEAGCSYRASLLDLSTAVQSNAQLAGWPQAHLREKITSHLFDI